MRGDGSTRAVVSLLRWLQRMSPPLPCISSNVLHITHVQSLLVLSLLCSSAVSSFYSHSVTKTNVQIGGRGLEQITQPRKKRRKQLALTSALTSKALGQLILCCEERDAEDVDGRTHVPVPRPPPARLLLAGCCCCYSTANVSNCRHLCRHGL